MNSNKIVKISGRIIVCNKSFGFIKEGQQFYCIGTKDDYVYLFSPEYNFEFKININLLKNFNIY